MQNAYVNLYRVVDVYHNFYVMVKGKKRFHLFGPEQSEHLYLNPR